jgi:hypothetical protein
MKPVALALLLMTSCAQPNGTSCYSRPADFMSDEDWWKGMPPSIDLYPKNVIKVLKTGGVTWNEAPIDTQHGWAPVLDMYLELVPQMEPPPIIFLDWEEGAPCGSIDRVRELMRKRLGCDGSRKCVQGRPDKTIG